MGGHGRGFRSLELVPITPKLGQYFGTDKGLLVVRAPAAAGSKLEEGDVILTIGGRTPENPRHAFRILGSYQPSEQVKVEVLRQRKRMTVEMQVPEAGDGPGVAAGAAAAERTGSARRAAPPRAGAGSVVVADRVLAGAPLPPPPRRGAVACAPLCGAPTSTSTCPTS